MIYLELKTSPHTIYGDNDVRAFVEYEGKEIDSHIHSSESWLINDWFAENNGFSHKEKITTALNGQLFELRYKNHILTNNL